MQDLWHYLTEKLLTWVALVVTFLLGLFGKEGYKWLVTRKQDQAKTEQIATDISIAKDTQDFVFVEKAKETARELVEASKQAAAAEVSKGKAELELHKAQESMEQMNRRLDRMQKSVLIAGRILVECFELMKARGIDTSVLEEQVKRIHTE